MSCLAIESSTSYASVALEVNGQVFFRESHRQNSHTEFINLAVQECLDQAKVKIWDVDLFCCTQGPGSFTGIRVAANAVKTYSFTCSKPLFWKNSLELVHLQNPSESVQMVLVNAFKNMLYVAAYHEKEIIIEPCSVRFLDLKNVLARIQAQRISVVGEALQIYPQILTLDNRLFRPDSPRDLPSALTLIQLSKSQMEKGWTKDWKDFHPLYIRASEAEEKSRVI